MKTMTPPPTFQNTAANLDLEAPTQHDPCNQRRPTTPANQPRPRNHPHLQPATTHGGDEHGSDHPRQRERRRRTQRERRQRERRRRPSQNRDRDLYWWVGQSLFFCFCCLTPLFVVCSFFFRFSI
ncbi:hypothetical protein AAZV13_13G022300 [Glycine max]